MTTKGLLQALDLCEYARVTFKTGTVEIVQGQTAQTTTLGEDNLVAVLGAQESSAPNQRIFIDPEEVKHVFCADD